MKRDFNRAIVSGIEQQHWITKGDNIKATTTT